MLPQDVECYQDNFRREGFATIEGVISPEQVNSLQSAIASIPHDKVLKKADIYGVRNLMSACPAVEEIARHPALRKLVTPILGADAFAVRATFFDKSPGSNWSLFWHRDTAICVKQRIEAPGFSSWSRKAGVWHVRPPTDVLAKMIAVRLHLDDCGPDSGPLRIMPRSHRSAETELSDHKTRTPAAPAMEVVCTVGSGGALIMCPLTLHASGQSRAATHRRVVHIEYAAEELPFGLQWNERVGKCAKLAS